jgi:hypothetical protein
LIAIYNKSYYSEKPALKLLSATTKLSSEKMKKTFIFIISILSTLLLCGFTPQSIAISTAALTIFLWVKALENIRGASLCAINNPQQHNPELIAEALSNCLKQIKSSEKETQLLISNPGINPLTIHSTPDNEMKIHDFHRTLRVENGNLWIADHPLPLILKAGQCRQLNFVPASDGRIHVSTGEIAHYGKLPLMLIPLAAILFFFNFHCAAAVLIAPIIHSLLSRN